VNIRGRGVLGYRVDYRLGLRNDDELGLGIARLDIASGSDVGVDGIWFVDVADDTDLWLVLEEAIDESFQVGIAEVVIEHPHRDLEVQVLVCLIPTVFSKPGKKSEGQRISDEWNSMEERHMVRLSGGSDVASRAGVWTQIEGHD
jgi:hypothetical protein